MSNPITFAVQNGHLPFPLPYGGYVNLLTQHGAETYIKVRTSVSPFHDFTETVEILRKYRRKSHLTEEDKRRMMYMYIVTEAFVSQPSQAVFATQIPKSEVECWFDYMNDMLPKFQKHSKLWKQVGKLEDVNDYSITTNVGFFKHLKGLEAAFDKDFFSTLARFIASREAPKLPCPSIAENVTYIVNYAFVSHLHNQQEQQGNGKFWKKMEASGLLLQYIRCSTIPQPHFEDPGIYHCYDDLLKNCLPLIRKKFKKGQPCGDVLHAIISGEDCKVKKNPKVMTYIRNLATLAIAAQDIPCSIRTLRTCRNCNKGSCSKDFQKSLMQCGRCKQAYYCSKECQKKDWKKHKLICQEVDKAVQKESHAKRNCMESFLEDNYIHIMDKLLSAMKEYALPKEELLVEVDFAVDENGIAPALKSPAEFVIKDTRGYFEGDCPNEPDWFFKNHPEFRDHQDRYKSNVKSAMDALKDHYSRMTPNHLLCFTRNSELGGWRIYKLVFQSKQKGKELFSPEALEAFRKAVYENDFSDANHIFDVDILFRMRSFSVMKGFSSMRFL